MVPNPFSTKELHAEFLINAERGVLKEKLSERRPVFQHRYPSTTTRGTTVLVVGNPQRTSTVVVAEPILKVPSFAWALHDIWTKEVARRHWWVAAYNLQILTFTAATIAAAVFYGHYFEGYPALDDHVAVALFASTVAFPPYVALLVKRKSTMLRKKPLPMALLESIIFKFRAQAVDEWDHQTAKDLLKKSTQKLCDGVSFQQLPEDFWEDDEDDDDHETDMESFSDSGLLECIMTTNVNHEELPCLPRDPEAAVPTETTPILVEEATDDDSQVVKKEKEDDRYSLLTADEYMEFRIDKIAGIKRDERNTLQSRQNLLQNAIKAITFSATGTALVSMQWILPVLLAVTAACGSALEFGSYDQSIEEVTEMVQKLDSIKSRWEEEEDDSTDALVEEAEAAILQGTAAH